jgi:hypothetical protein
VNGKLQSQQSRTPSVYDEAAEWTAHLTNEEKISPSVGDYRKNATASGGSVQSPLITDRSWECSIYMKCLMPWPHFELGSQDFYSIQATEVYEDLNVYVALK